MNINAKQMTEIATSRMDITTVLGYFGQIRGIVTQNQPLVSALGTVWTAFTAAYNAFDDAYAQARKWAQTQDIETLDTQRDQALSPFNAALKSMQSSPNQAKQQAARQLMFIREKYTISASDEYMKETTAIQQMVQEMEASMQAQAALATTGLDDWFTDLKAKNEAFLQKMNERTEAQAGQQKGIEREKRLLAEAAYKNVVKLINAAAIMEVPADLDYSQAIDLLNAEVEHYRQILVRKGVSTGSGGGGGSDDQGGGDDGDTPTPTPTPEPTPDPTPTPDPSGGGGGGDGGDDSGGGLDE